ncbi:MAG: PAS domain S-box protein [Rhodoferax sp.]|uniref:PAS domain-containing hybrid sensor histidine kinase/response regulator n=1 Tax=Rhodoferax sp. TaxID=50421 RepID=UPI00261911BE|nr:PAS domain-containing hybrid sensor histidine kinase/response regulator [Rhodoferax sp.]MDD2878870.1 PAS domain S-box protein [Rhodoferax sp.]
MTSTHANSPLADLQSVKKTDDTVINTRALQSAIFNSANFSSIATDAKGVIQIFNVGAERMLGYAATDVMNKITPADISDPHELIARAKALSLELETPITPGFEALVFKASRGIEDIYELTYIRKDGSRFPAVVSVTALRDAQDSIIGYLLIGTDNTARKQAEEALIKAGALQKAIFDSANFSSIATDAKGVIQIFNVGAERMLGCLAADVVNKITPADISDPLELIARAKTLSLELDSEITPGFEALVFKASRGIEDIYELTYIRKDGSRFPAVVSVTALRDDEKTIIGYFLIGTDNTARKQAEDALLKAGALQNAIFDSANFSSIATDAKGVIQIFNVGAERMLGYTAFEVMNQRTPADISDPQEIIARARTLSLELDTPIAPGFEALVFKASRGIEDIYELTYIRKDGSRFPAVVSVTALRDAQDSIIGYLLIGTDNTARKQAEEALLKAGALQSAIFNSANFSSIATDAKGVIQIFNVGAERMLGYAAADVMNKITPADISDPEEVIARAMALSVELDTAITPGFEALVFKASRGIEDIYELTYIRKDGSRFPAVVSVTALRDAQGVIIGYLLIGTDNTARKQVEADQKLLAQRLRDHQFYTRSLFESNIDALMTTDLAGIITDVNKQMEALTGCTRDELIGAPFKSHFTDPHRAEISIKRVLLEKKVSNYELTVRTRDGKETVVSFNATTFYDRERTLQGVFAAARDVTESKRLDLELKEKNIELENARSVAEKANLAKSDFLSSMSHEIRSPLNAILGLAYLLEQANLELEANNMVRKIKASGRMLLRLISDILDVSKIEAGQMMIEQAPFRLPDVIDNLAVILGVAVGDKDIKLVIQPPPAGVFSVVGDALRLEQVLLNLSINAIKFTSVGQVELVTELLSSGHDELVLRFCVRDSGIGIAPELQSSVFAPFTQADSSTTRRFGGTGLGLTICRQLVQLMGGEIGLNSVVGQGSEFWFTVPLKKLADTELSESDQLRIDALIADDSQIALKYMSGITEGLGWHVNTLDSGEAVLSYLQARTERKLPDVVVLDWKMPGLDGLATARAIRDSMPQEKCPLIIMTTAHSLTSMADRAGTELVDALLEKPVSASGMYNALIEARRKRAATDGMKFGLHRSSGQVLASIRVLVVDDSEINCEVARRILHEKGAVVSLAANGQEALDWLLAHPNDIDLVLMDVQMPVMDGIEATRQLRQMPAFAKLPIVALTAGAFKSQQDAAQAAGMTHFISKPFDVPSTIALIQRLTRQPKMLTAGAPAPVSMLAPESVPAMEPVPPRRVFTGNVSVLDMAAGLEIWGDMPSYLDYLQRFATIYSNAVALMNTSLAQADQPAATALAHKLAGVAANLALPEVRRLAAETERLLRADLDPALVLADLAAAITTALVAIDRVEQQAID